MRKYVFLFAFLPLSASFAASEPQAALPQTGEANYSQSTSASGELVGETVTKSSLVKRIDAQLNDKTLRSTVLDYAFPQELKPAAEKCITEPDACYFSYKFYESAAEPAVAARANLELAVLSLQRGLVKQALAHIQRAAELTPEDPFTELTRGWILFSAGKYKKARQAFANMLYLTADFEYASSARLGTALAYYFEGNAKASAEAFQHIYTSNPYMISFAAYMMGRLSADKKPSRHQAPVFLQQALSHDSAQFPALQLLARLAEKDKKNPRVAFQYYSTLFSVDQSNASLKKKALKYAEKLSGNMTDYLFYMRLDQPIVQNLASSASQTVKMALYADRWQHPLSLQSAQVIPSGVMTVWDEKLGEVLKSPSYVTRVLEFNPETKSVDVKDKHGHVSFSARRPFVIRLDKDEKTLLVKNITSADVFAADFSDKELKGALAVIPGQDGMMLVNEAAMEDLIPSLLATQARDVKDPQALAALAVVFRAALQEAVHAPTDKPYHITDNDVYFKFKGVNLTVLAMLQAAKDSRGLELSGTELGYYASCGPVSFDAQANTQAFPAYIYSPANLSKYMISNPPADLFSAPVDETRWSDVKWLYLYEAKDMQARLHERVKFGKLRAIIPLTLSPQGRVLTMRFEGSKGVFETQSPQETAYILSADTQRSNFFDVIPMYKGKNIERVLLRGYDTGTGVGLCVNGAEGLARSGSDYQGIIKYYFPNARILDTHTGEVH